MVRYTVDTTPAPPLLSARNAASTVHTKFDWMTVLRTKNRSPTRPSATTDASSAGCGIRSHGTAAATKT